MKMSFGALMAALVLASLQVAESSEALSVGSEENTNRGLLRGAGPQEVSAFRALTDDFDPTLSVLLYSGLIVGCLATSALAIVNYDILA